MTSDGFEATFRLSIDRDDAWRRLTARRGDDGTIWLPGFDSAASVDEESAPARLRATKVDEPCAGSDVVVVLEDDATGTIVRVVQSRFGDRLPAPRELMAVGWRFIVADLHAYLATGVHARRHLRAWGDLGADTTVADGGVRIDGVRPGGLAERLGLATGDVVVALAGAPIASADDLVTALRVLDARASEPAAEWIRDGRLCQPV